LRHRERGAKRFTFLEPLEMEKAILRGGAAGKAVSGGRTGVPRVRLAGRAAFL
jgi:hypothetical protein